MKTTISTWFAFPAWLAGTWEATVRSPAGAGQDPLKLTVKPDGTFQESIQSARGGAVSLTGTRKVSGENAILDGTYSEGPPRMQGTKRTLTVKKSDDNTLERMRWSQSNNQTLPISYTRRLGIDWPDDGLVNSLDESESIIVEVTPTRVFSWGHRLAARLAREERGAPSAVRRGGAPVRTGASPCTRGRATSRPAPALGSRRGVVPSRTGRPSTSRCRSRHRSRREPRRH